MSVSVENWTNHLPPSLVPPDDFDDEDEEEDEDDEDEEDDEEEEEEEESSSEIAEERVPTPKNAPGGGEEELDTDQETDRLLGQQYNDDNGYFDQKVSERAERTSGTKCVFSFCSCVVQPRTRSERRYWRGEVKPLRRKHPGWLVGLLFCGGGGRRFF